MTATIDITRKRGDTRRIVFDITEDGAPVDVSGWTAFKLTVDPSKSPADDTTKVEQMDGASDGAVENRVYFIPTGTIDPGAYFYDAQALDSNAEKITFAEGKYKVTQDITKT